MQEIKSVIRMSFKITTTAILFIDISFKSICILYAYGHQNGRMDMKNKKLFLERMLGLGLGEIP